MPVAWYSTKWWVKIINNVNFDEDDFETIINFNFMAWHNRVKQLKVFIKDIRKELMPVAWHPIRW